MPDAPNAAFSPRFYDDLRRIREDRGVALEALHEETKIPLELLRQFEETGLFDHPMFNRVYLRSLVRAYADTIGISTEGALSALDEALAGAYEGRLAVEYLGEAPPVAETAALEPDADEAPPAPAADVAAPPSEAQPSAPPLEAMPPAAPPRPVPPKREERPPPAPQEVLTPAWEAQSPPPVSRRSRPVDVQERSWNRQWIFIGGAVIVLAAAIWGALLLIQRPAADQAGQQVAAVDTSAADTTEALPQARSQAVLGDTMDVVVIAATGKVERIRITRDDDLRRPYWIEQGDARAFPVLERIVIEDRLDRIRLLVEGYRYPTDRLDEQGRIVITRQDAQAFLDTVSGPPVDLPAELETLRQAPNPTSSSGANRN